MKFAILRTAIIGMVTSGAIFAMSLPSTVYAADECAKEGEPWTILPPRIECCKGLTATSKWQFTQKSCAPPIPGDSGSCVKCGDGKCDSKNFENKCSCPKDCPTK